jgi:hypothetical protein
VGKNRVFFPVAALDLWIGQGKVDLSGEEVTIKAEGRRYRIMEAAHVMAEVSGASDVHELVGKVKSRLFLSELGAELLESSMILGDNAYDIIPGFLGAPVGSFEEHRASTKRAGARQSGPPFRSTPPVSDEDLLARLLLENR